MSLPLIVLPRPGPNQSNDNPSPIAAPSESSFIAAFGSLLPLASYLQTPHGRAAYYTIPPSSPSSSAPISRVLFVHGVQTCAIGLQPLASELSKRFPSAEIVLFDLWGHGLTDMPFTPHTPALFHSLISSLLAHLSWADAHFLGYSFGGSTVATFAAAHPKVVSSLVLIAPAGLIRSSQFSDLEHTYLLGGTDLEAAARDFIIDWLNGGPVVIPSDWKERVAHGEVVAEAVRDWEMKNHPGHAASIVGIFRDGGALDMHAEFKQAAASGIKCLSVLGQNDEVCSEQDLDGVGFEEVVTISGVGHGLVRERVPEVAALIEEFWKGLEVPV